MKLFTCQSCSQVVYFENTKCERCSHSLGYLPGLFGISALEADGPLWRPLAVPDKLFRLCDNAGHHACNWLIEAASPDTLCLACRHNQTIPDLSVAVNVDRWRHIEVAKHRLFYSLMRLGLSLKTKTEDPEHGLAFAFLASTPEPAAPRALTGHDNGLITIALDEADDAERERRRTLMKEPYRSLLGHFRHEVGHYFWDVLVRGGGRLDDCRALFGDDTQDYGQGLQAYYEKGAPANWPATYISAYASSHPWEDWAETWAHYLHIVDTVEMASACGIHVRPHLTREKTLAADIDINPYQSGRFKDIVDAWLPLTFAMNSINRAMGNPDLYPFILSPPIIAKLEFVHDLTRAGRGQRHDTR